MASLKEWARLGAAQRASELEAELAAIRRAFPDLASRRRVQDGGAGGLFRPEEGKTTSRRRKPMSAAQKAEVSRRMKAYWAKRRKGR